jgi:hypothetical protein
MRIDCIDVHNPNGTILRDIECSWKVSLSRIEDNIDPATLDITVNRKQVPIRQFARIVAKSGGNVVFMGYAESDSYDGDMADWQCFGAEKMLTARWLPKCYWPSGTKLQTILGHTVGDGMEPGFLGMANCIPPGTTHEVYSRNANIIKLTGRGTNSHFGLCDFYSCGLMGLRKLSEITDLNRLSSVDYAFYRTTTDTYIRISNGYDRGWIKNGGLIAENAYDTHGRFLSLSEPDFVLPTDIDVDGDEIGETIVATAFGNGFYTHIRYSEEYAYLYFDKNIGGTVG